jgi:hypothetical protein
MDELFSPTWLTKGIPAASAKAQGPELLYPTFNSRQSAMLMKETLRD